MRSFISINLNSISKASLVQFYNAAEWMIRMKYWGGSCSPYICYMRFSSIFSDEKSGIRIRKEKMIVHEVEFIALGQNLKTVLFKFSWSYVLISHDANRMTKCWSQCHIFYIYRYVLGDVIPHDMIPRGGKVGTLVPTIITSVSICSTYFLADFFLVRILNSTDLLYAWWVW